MTFKTYLANNRELLIHNVQSIREVGTTIVLYPPDKEQCAIAVDGVLVMRSDRPQIDIRTISCHMTIFSERSSRYEQENN